MAKSERTRSKTALTRSEKFAAAAAGGAQGVNLTNANFTTLNQASLAPAAHVTAGEIVKTAAYGQLMYGLLLLARLLVQRAIATRWQMVAAAWGEAVALLALVDVPSAGTLAAAILLAPFVGSTLGTLRIALRQHGKDIKHVALRDRDQAVSYTTVTVLTAVVTVLIAWVGWRLGICLLAVVMAGWGVFLTWWRNLPMARPHERVPLRSSFRSLQSLLVMKTARWGIVTNVLLGASFQMQISAAQLHFTLLWPAAVATSFSWGLSLGRILSLPLRRLVSKAAGRQPGQDHRMHVVRTLLLCAVPVTIGLALLLAAGFVPADRLWVTVLALAAPLIFEAGMNGATPVLSALINDQSAEAATLNGVAQALLSALAAWGAAQMPWWLACVLTAAGAIATAFAGWRLVHVPRGSGDPDPADQRT